MNDSLCKEGYKTKPKEKNHRIWKSKQNEAKVKILLS